MKLLVTGAGGLLGGETVKRIGLLQDHQIIALSTQTRDALLKRWGAGLRHDLIDVLTPDEFFRNPSRWGKIDAVVNCAWPLNLGGIELARGLDYHVELFRAVNLAAASTLVNVSSQSVYNSKRDYPATEDSPLDLDGPYAAAKYSCELLAGELAPNVRVVNARLASIIHPQFDRRLVNKMTKHALEHGTIKVAGPQQILDFMDARDAAHALVGIALEPGNYDRLPVNVGSSNPLSLEQIALRVKTAIKTTTRKEVLIEYTSEGSRVHSSSIDTRRLKTLWNFEPMYSIDDTINSVIASYVESAEADIAGDN